MLVPKAEKTFSTVNFDRLVHDFMTTGDFAVMRVIEDCVSERLSTSDAERALDLIVPPPKASEREILRRYALAHHLSKALSKVPTPYVVAERGSDEPRIAKREDALGTISAVIVGRDWLVSWRMRDRPAHLSAHLEDPYQSRLVDRLYVDPDSGRDLEAACACATSSFWIKKWFVAAGHQCRPETLTTIVGADSTAAVARSIQSALLLMVG